MIVTWVTLSQTPASIVEYGLNDLAMTAKGMQKVFVDGGSEHRIIFMHHVTLTGLIPGQKYGIALCNML
jgi:acid phosphatase type 7